MSCKQKKEIICSNNRKIYELGLKHGHDDGGFTEGYDAGKQEEYDTFWDVFQNYGNRRGYSYAFRGEIWNDTIFKPKYDIKTEGSTDNMFQVSEITDLKAICERQKIVLDFSYATGFMYTFSNSSITNLGIIDTRNASIINTPFNNAKELVTIEKLILKGDGSQTFGNAFTNANSLENITIEGVIGQNGFDIHWSTKLTKASITSIINALKTSAWGFTITLSQKAINKAFETSEGANDGETSTEWLTLKSTKQNSTAEWTISLL